MKRKVLIPGLTLLLCVFINTFTYAQVQLPDIFSSNMVLQQKSKIKFWGWANPTQKVAVVASWNRKDTLKTITAADAKWSVVLQTPEAGGPYEIKVISDTTLIIHNIEMGEVWLCSGQSNMEFSADWHFNNYKEEIKNANHPEIRFFKINKISAPYPQVQVRGKWQVCTSKTMHSFSAAGYFFGRKLNNDLKRPIGLIESCWGGTPVEAWTPIEVFNQHTNLATSAAKLTPVPWCPVRPAVAYNAMIYPLIHFPIAGVIWYQGEENTANPLTYEETFSMMIHSWRSLWDKEFPFYFVQIAPFNYGTPYSAALVREAQFKTYRNVPNTGMVVTTDITSDTTNIHPKDKQDVGKRLALWALAKTYRQKGISYSGPLYKSMKIRGNKAIIYFDYAHDGLMKKGKQLTEFKIAGSDHQFKPAEAYIRDSTVVVYNSKVRHPVAVRMGFSNTAIPNLFNKAGLPASPFRTDDWPVLKQR